MITTWAFVAFVLYELFSFPLYVRIIYVLLRRPDFKNPFYRLICINGIFEMCHYVDQLLFFRLPMFAPTMGLFPTSPSRLITAPIAASFLLIYQIFVLHFAVSLNRFTAIFTPFKHKKFWKKWWPAVPLIGFILSIGLTFHRIFSVSQFILINAECGYTPAPVKYDFYSLNQNFLTAAFGSFSLFSCLFVNGATLAKILQQKRANKAAQPQQNFKHEIHLFIVTVWMMLFMSIFIALQVAVWGGISLGLNVMPTDSNNSRICFLLSQLPWVEDAFSLSQPWVLLLANRAVRVQALPFLKKLAHLQQQQKQLVTVKPVEQNQHPKIHRPSKST